LIPLIGVGFAALTILPTTIVVLVGIVPSLAALVVDETRQKYLFRSVLGMNLAALWPFLERLWLHGNEVRHAIVIVVDVYTWAVIYGAAGVGWLMFMGLPHAVTTFKEIIARQRVIKLKKIQHDLIEEWGSVLPGGETPPVADDSASVQEPA
jgi:hypothetical protein